MYKLNSADPSGSRRVRADGSSCSSQSTNAKAILYSHNSKTCPNSACLRLPDSQILWFLRFSERLLEPDYLYRGQSGRSRPG